jgi:MurNAc alpha-1-phosphate uridylyltransferase
MIKKAMILAAGFGKRLNPLTLHCPKPLLKIGKETLLSNTINFLEQSKIKEVVINVHYLGDQIIEYLNKKKFNLNIIIINEKEKILDTGGGICNALKYFNESFLCINPDTIWNLNYIKELKQMENNFFLNKKKSYLLVVNKIKSFDTSLKGDFNLHNGLVTRKKGENLKYIYTGLQIIDPEIFLNISDKIFSINKVWDKLIQSDQLFAMESNIDFLHASTLNVYKKLNIK